MNKLSNTAKLEINQVLAPIGLKITASITSEGFNLYEITGNSSKVVNKDKCFEEVINHKAVDPCTRCKIMSIFNKAMKGGLNMANNLFTEISEVTPLLTDASRVARMVGEFWELQIRITKLTRYLSSHPAGVGQHQQLVTMTAYRDTLLNRLRTVEKVDVYDQQWKVLAKLNAAQKPVQPKVEAHVVVANIAVPAKDKIEKVIANEAGKTVIVFFKDGGKEVVHCSKEDTFDVYVGVSIAISRHLNGTTSKFRRLVDKITIVQKAKKAKEPAKEEAPAKRGPGRPRKTSSK